MIVNSTINKIERKVVSTVNVRYGKDGKDFKFEDFTPEQLALLKGENGKSNYQLWLDEGNTGSVQDYLDSQKGSDATVTQENIENALPYTIANNKLSNLAENLTDQEKAAIKEKIGADYYVNVKDFGAVGDGVADDTTAVNTAITYAFDNNIPLFITEGDYLVKDQIRIKSIPILGVKEKSRFIIASDFSFTDTGTGKSITCIFNDNYANSFSSITADSINLRDIDIVANIDSINVTQILGFANVKKGLVENIDIHVPSARTSSVTGLDLRAVVKNINFNNCHVLIENQSGSGGNWVRNITDDGSLADNVTENITFKDCSFKNAQGDEAFAIYGVQGKVKNIKCINTTFEALPSSETHSVLVSVFALDNETANSAYSSIEGVIFDKCKFIDKTFTAHVFRSGDSGVDENNVLDGIKVIDSTFYVAKSVSETSYVARHISGVGNNNSFIGNSIYSTGSQKIFYAINGFDLVKSNYVNSWFNYGIDNCKKVVDNFLDEIDGIGINNCQNIYNNKVSSRSHSIRIDKIDNKKIIKNNELSNLPESTTSHYRIWLLTNVSANIDNNIINVTNAGQYAVRRDGEGSVRIINNTITGSGKTISSSNKVTELRGNNWYGILEDYRSNPVIDVDHNIAVPLGQIVRNSDISQGVEAWRKTSSGWEVVNIHFFSLSDIGLSKGSETVEDIYTNLPVNSILSYDLASGTFADIYPSTRGTVEFFKHEFYMVLKFVHRTTLDHYKGYYFNSWLGWEKIIDESNLLDTSRNYKALTATDPSHAVPLSQLTDNGTTANRPTANLLTGQQFFDTALGKPIYYNGSGWVDATGAAV